MNWGRWFFRHVWTAFFPSLALSICIYIYTRTRTHTNKQINRIWLEIFVTVCAHHTHGKKMYVRKEIESGQDERIYALLEYYSFIFYEKKREELKERERVERRANAQLPKTRKQTEWIVKRPECVWTKKEPTTKIRLMLFLCWLLVTISVQFIFPRLCLYVSASLFFVSMKNTSKWN